MDYADIFTQMNNPKNAYLKGRAAGTRVARSVIQFFEMMGSLRKFVASLRDVPKSVINADFGEAFKKLFNQTGYDVLDLVEDLLLFIENLYRCTSTQHIASAVYSFLKCRYRGTGPMFVSAYTYLLRVVDNLFIDVFEVQGEGFQNVVGDMMLGIATVQDSELLRKLKTLISYLIGYGVFECFGIEMASFPGRSEKLIKAVVKRPFDFSLDFVHSILETVQFLVDRGVRYMQTGSFSEIFSDSSEISKWSELVRKHLEIFVAINDPDVAGVDLPQYRLDAEELLARGNEFLRYKKLMRYSTQSIVERQVGEIRSQLLELNSRRNVFRTRRPPLAVLLCGGSGVGKTYLADCLFKHFAKVSTCLGRPLESGTEFKFSVNASANFWDGFESHHWGIFIDELGPIKPEAANGVDPSLATILQVINAAPYLPDQARLEDKGKKQCRPEFVVATSNSEDLNAHAYFQHPLAVQRRFRHIIVPKPKPEYAQERADGFMMLDSSKLTSTPGYSNYWDFVVKRVEPGPLLQRRRQAAKIVEVATFHDINDMLNWFGGIIENHYSDQVTLMSDISALDDIQICGKVTNGVRCFKDRNVCSCNGNLYPNLDVQGESEIDIFYEYSWREWLSHCHREFFWWMLHLVLITIFSLSLGSLYFFVKLLKFKTKGGQRPALIVRMNLSILRWARSHILDVASNRMCAILSRNQGKILGWTAAVASLIACYKAYRKLTQQEPVVQGTMLATGKNPVPCGVEKPNVWRNDDQQITTYDLTPTITSQSKVSEPDLISKLFRNTYIMRVYRNVDGETRACYGKVVALGGHLYVTNRHHFKVGSFAIEIGKKLTGEGVCDTREIRVDSHNMFEVPQSDLVFLNLLALPPKKNIANLFCRSTFHPQFVGGYVGCNKDGSVFTRGLAKGRVCNVPISSLSCTISGYMASVELAPVEGDCGALMYATTSSGPICLGIHVAYDASNKVVVGTAVTRQLIQKAIEHFDQYVIQSGSPMLVEPIGPLHPKSTVRFIESGSLHVYGTLRIAQRYKSRVTDTFIRKEIVALTADTDLPIVPKHCAPLLTGWIPKHNNLLKMVKTANLFESAKLRLCSDAFLKDILNNLPEEELNLIEIYDLPTVVNGAPGVSFVDKTNRKTSAGYPWCKSKLDLLTILPPDDVHQHPARVDREVLDRAEIMLETYKSGAVVNPVFVAHFKDEPITFAKRDKSKTRIFCGAPFDFTIIVRKFYLSLIRVMQRNMSVFECAIGISAQCKQWDELYQSLTHFGTERIIAGDYSSFDKTMPPDVMLESFRVLIELARIGGYSDDDLRIMQGIAEDISFPTVMFFGELYQFFGTNPSGHPLTVVINSIANSIYMRYAYLELHPTNDVTQFQKHVSLRTYGDDNIMGVSEEAPWFNHLTIQLKLASLDIVYTTADKSAVVSPYISISEATFLKRSFVYDDTLGYIVGPLDHDSFCKMLTVCIPSKCVLREVQALEVMKTALSEYFWYGSEIFEERYKIFQHLLTVKGLDHFLLDGDCLPDYQTLRERYEAANIALDKSREVAAYQVQGSAEELVLPDIIRFWDNESTAVIPLPRVYHYTNLDYFSEVIQLVFVVYLGLNTLKRYCEFLLGVRSNYTKWENWSGPLFQVLFRSPIFHLVTFGVFFYYLAFLTYNVAFQVSSLAIVYYNMTGKVGREGLWRILRNYSSVSDRLGRSRFKATPDTLGFNSLDKKCGQSLRCLSVSSANVTPGSHLLRLCSDCDKLVRSLGRSGVELHENRSKTYFVMQDSLEKFGGSHPGPFSRRNAIMMFGPTSSIDSNFVVQGSDDMPATSVAPVVRNSDPSQTVPQVPSLLTDQVATEQEQVVSFVGDDPTPAIEFEAPRDATFLDDALPASGLAEFLERPVKIHEITLTEGIPIPFSAIQPWHLFFNNTTIKKKIDNYAFINCTLHIKIVINASPFYYGSVLVAYDPLTAFHAPILWSDKRALAVSLSQRPHVWIYPQNNQGGEMTLPFFYHKNWLDLTSAADLQAMGELDILELIALRNANGVSGGVLTAQVYAWATDVNISGPTLKLAVQGSDEYGVGPVSKVASAVASAAKYLVPVPVIGPFAKATEIGASAVSKIASLFGFTNVNVIDDTKPVKNNPFHSLASAGIGEPLDKLTIDPKNELSLDPRTVGLSSGDEMSIEYIVSREAFLNSTNWASTDASDTLLFNCPVTPALFLAETPGASDTYVAMTPMCMISQQFQYWRGDIVFRIKAICTQYHKGRIRITWDPLGDLVSTSDTTTTSFTKIVDLEPDMDVAVRCSYNQSRHWLSLDTVGTGNPSQVVGDSFTNKQNAFFNNGALTIRVLNELSSPVSTSTVTLMVFVKGCENLEFMDPHNHLPVNSSYFAVQGSKDAVWSQDATCESIAGGKAPSANPDQYLVYGGETIASVRPLLRRSVLNEAIDLTASSHGPNGNTAFIVNINQTKYPSAYGYDPKGYGEAVSILATGNKPFNWSGHNFFESIVPCYVGMRGSMRWQYNLDTYSKARNVITTMKVDRYETTVPTFTAGRVERITTSGVTATNYSQAAAFYMNNLETGTRGTALTTQETQAGLAVEIPHYYPFRFAGTNPAYWNVGFATDDTLFKHVTLKIITKPILDGDAMRGVVVERFFSIGNDFTCFFFLNVPTLYIYASTPAPP